MADEIHTVGVKVEADTAGADKFNKALQDMTRRMTELERVNQKLRDGFRQQAQQTQASATSSGFFTNQLKVLGAQLLAMVTVVALVNKGLGEFKSAIAAAATLEEQADLFGDLIGNADKAKKTLEGVLNWWRGAGKIFAQENVLAASNQMLALGVQAENILPSLQRFGAASAIAGGQMTDWVDLMTRVTRGQFLKDFGGQMNFFVKTVAELNNLDPSKARAWLDALPSERIPAVWLQFMEEMSKRQGALSEEANQYNNALQALDSTWLDLKQQFAKPIINALTPIILDWTTKLGTGKSRAEEWGNATVKVIEDINNTLKTTDWDKFFKEVTNAVNVMVEALKVALRVAESIKSVTTTGDLFPAAPAGGMTLMQELFSPVGLPAAGTRAGLYARWQNYQAGGTFTGVLPPANQPFGPPAAGTAGGAPSGLSLQGGVAPLGLPGVAPFVGNPLEKVALTAKDASASVKELTGDIGLLSKFWTEWHNILATSTDETSRHWHQMQLVAATIPLLGNPIKDVEKLIKNLAPDDQTLARWMALEEQAKRTLENISLKAEANMATMGQLWSAGLQKLSKSWGSWQTQTINMIGDIGNALSTNIAGGLTDILNGTKSISQGFRDMALSVVESIQRIIVQMLVQLAIQQLISALSGGTWFGGNLMGQPAGPIRPAIPVHARGGPVTGGSGTRDDVPIMAMAGEYVLNKRATRNIGIETLDMMNRMREGGAVRGYATGGITISGGGPRNSRQSSWEQYEDMVSRFGLGRGFQDLSGNFRPYWTLNPPGSGPLSPSDRARVEGGGGGQHEWGGGWGLNSPLAGAGGPSQTELGLYGGGPSGMGTWGGTGASPWGRHWLDKGSPPGSGTDTAARGGATGGYVTPWGIVPSFARGGVMPFEGLAHLHAGERVTPAGASPTINISITNVAGRTEASTETSGGGMTDADARNMARMVTTVVQAEIQRQTRTGGALHIPRSRRG